MSFKSGPRPLSVFFLESVPFPHLPIRRISFSSLPAVATRGRPGAQSHCNCPKPSKRSYLPHPQTQVFSLCQNTQGSPFPSLPEQSPKPEVLAPDTSCSNVALRWGNGTEVDLAENPLHPAWHREGERGPWMLRCAPPPMSSFPVPGSWSEENAGAIGGPPAVWILAANTVPVIEHGTAA